MRSRPGNTRDDPTAHPPGHVLGRCKQNLCRSRNARPLRGRQDDGKGTDRPALAIEHGNGNRPEIPVEVAVTQDGDEIIVAITDQGGEVHPDADEHEDPDLVRKLDGDQSPRGWGLFLIRNMVDAMDITTDGQRHTIWLTMRTGGASHDERM